MNSIAASGDTAQRVRGVAISADLRLRVLSALILAPIALGVVYIGYPLFDFMVAAAAVMMTAEWRRISGYPPFDPVGSVMAAVVVSTTLLTGLAGAAAAVLLSLPGAIAAALISRLRREPKQVIAVVAIGVIAIGSFGVALVWLRSIEGFGLSGILWLLIAVWMTDIFAYFFGRLIGGPKLAPRISPNKTWAGLAGGMVAASVWSLAWAAITASAPVGAIVLAGAGTALLAQIGDLGVSMLKRRFGVKDSGTIIPGHGGLLDRMDGFLGAAPLIALAIAIGGKGGAPWL